MIFSAGRMPSNPKTPGRNEASESELNVSHDEAPKKSVRGDVPLRGLESAAMMGRCCARGVKAEPPCHQTKNISSHGPPLLADPDVGDEDLAIERLAVDYSRRRNLLGPVVRREVVVETYWIPS